MRIALISDIHANLEALREVAAAIQKEKPDIIIHLGDVVGYGADPLECCRWVKEHCQVSLLGNHDAVIVGKMDTSYFSAHARIAIEWTARQIDIECKTWLESLPYTYMIDEFLFSHGSPINPDQFDYVLDYDTAEEIFRFMVKNNVKIVFVGHSHKAFLLEKKEGEIHLVDLNGNDVSEFHFDEENLYIVSVGSVGQPRDFDPRAYYAIFDTEKKYIVAKRVVYDIKGAADKIRDAGLPEVLADRLYMGR